MYSKNRLCVRIKDDITPLFDSHIGVRQGDVLSPNIFNIFLNDLPDMMSSCNNFVNVNNSRIDCLMYADDIVLLSDTKEGLQNRINVLQTFCNKWCLNINLKKTNILIFNKPGKFLNEIFELNGDHIECVKSCKYLGITFSSSGKFSQCKEELFKKSMKACFKLQQCLSSSNPSVSTLLHLYDHTIKPILLYGSEIWGIFSPSSSACKKNNNYILEKVFTNDISEKSHTKFMKYVLGVNKKSSNLAVMSELGRYPIYFSIILSMLKFCHRLENCTDGLLYDAYVCNKDLHLNNIVSWYSSIEFILKEFDLRNLNMSLTSLCNLTKDKLCKSFQKFWYDFRQDTLESEHGKLITYFSFKHSFGREKYLDLKEFKLRQALCKIRISAHPLQVETDRYSKKYIEKAKRICKHCNLDKVEDEEHFILECPKYNSERLQFFNTISSFFDNFINLNISTKFNWLFIQEDVKLLKVFATYLNNCLDIRRN